MQNGQTPAHHDAGRDLVAGHFALDTKADEIVPLVREFMKAQK
jgi:hypothetical protein